MTRWYRAVVVLFCSALPLPASAASMTVSVGWSPVGRCDVDGTSIEVAAPGAASTLVRRCRRTYVVTAVAIRVRPVVTDVNMSGDAGSSDGEMASVNVRVERVRRSRLDTVLNPTFVVAGVGSSAEFTGEEVDSVLIAWNTDGV